MKRSAAVILLVVTLVSAAACSRSNRDDAGPTEPPPSEFQDNPATPVTPLPNPVNPSAPALPPPTAAGTAASCAGRPTGQQVIQLVKDKQIVDPAARLDVATGPLCAGEWQYTVLSMPNADPLQVISRFQGTVLTLVTAGTDLCSDEATSTAPPAIRAAAHC